jgi:hypothetical protein
MKSELYVATVVGAYRRALDVMHAQLSGQDVSIDLEKEASEIAKMSNRQFTTGSLEQRAFADSINYDFAGYQKSHAFAGQVVEVIPDEGLFIQVRHPLESGNYCDFVTPAGVSAVIELNQMQDVNGTIVDRISPNRLIRIPYLPDIPVLSVLRLQLQEAVCT